MTLARTKLYTASKAELSNVSRAVAMSLLQVIAGTIHVQEVFAIIHDYDFDAKLFSLQIYSIQECHEIEDNILRSQFSKKISTELF